MILSGSDITIHDGTVMGIEWYALFRRHVTLVRVHRVLGWAQWILAPVFGVLVGKILVEMAIK